MLQVADDRFLFCRRRPAEGLEGFSDLVETAAGWLAVDGRSSAIVTVGHLTMAFSGRLHYMDVTTALLGLPAPQATWGVEQEGLLAAEAWSRWGAGALDKLVGTFAGVVVDLRTLRVEVFRDITAGRPAYLAMPQAEHLASSDLELVARWRGSKPRPSLRFVASHVQDQWLDGRETPYEGVEALEPGHVAVPAQTGWRVGRHAHWLPLQVGKRSAEGYVDLLAEVLDAAMAERLRGIRRAGVALSGGLDSTNVLAAGLRAAPDIEWTAYSIPFHEARGDEQERQRAVAEHLGVAQTWVDVAGKGPLGSHEPGVTGPPRWAGNWYFMRSIAQQASADGCEVVFDGEDADSLLTGNVLYLSDLLVRGRLPTWLREIRRLSSAGVVGRRLALNTSVLTVLPPVLRRRVVDAHQGATVSPLVPQPLAEATGLRDALARYFDAGWHPGRQFAAAQQLGCNPVQIRVVMEESARCFDETGVLDGHPFTDRKVIELALGLPWYAISPERPNKHLLDQLARRRLPSAYAGRFAKAQLDEYFEQAVRGFESELVFSGMQAAADLPEVFDSSALRSLRADFVNGVGSWEAVRAAVLASWLKAF